MNDQSMDRKVVLDRLDDLTALRASSGPVEPIVPFEKKIDIATKSACKSTENLWLIAILP